MNLIGLTKRLFGFRAMAIGIASAFLLGLSIGGATTWRVLRWMDASATLKVVAVEQKDRVVEEARLHEVGAKHAVRSAAIKNVGEGQKHELAELVQAHIDWADVDIGADGLCQWSAWNEGITAAAAGCGTAAVVPGDAAAAAQRPATGADGQPPAER